MKKIVISLLAASLGISSQLSFADQNTAAKLCPPLSEVKTLAFVNIEKSYKGKDRYNFISEYHTTHSYDSNYQYKFISYALHISGVKGKDAEDALGKVKKVLASAAEQQPNAIHLVAGSYEFQCIYALDFSQTGDDYNDIYPTAVVEISGTDFQNLLSVPAKF